MLQNTQEHAFHLGPDHLLLLSLLFIEHLKSLVGPEIFLKRTYLGLFNILVFQYYSMASRYADSVYRIHFTLALNSA